MGEMKRTLLLVVAWSTATLLAVGVAAAAVGSVRGQVTSVPAVPIRATATSLASGEAVAPPVASTGASAGATTIPAGDSGPDSVEIATVAGEAAAETTVDTDDGPAATTSTATAPSASQEQTTTTATPTTTVPSASSPTATASGTTTTTKAPAASTRHTYDLVGGTVSVEVGDGTVVLVGASPKSGFSVRVENAGPQRVEVSFENAMHVSHFSGRFSDGSYVPKVEEHDRHDGDDRGGRDHDGEFGN